MSEDPAVLSLRIAELEAENRRLRDLLGIGKPERQPEVAAWEPSLFGGYRPSPRVDQTSSPEEKIKLFRELFTGRSDVYAVRWENQRSGKSGWSPAIKGGWANTRRPDRELLALTDDVVSGHLAGRDHVGLYPLLQDDRCRVLACDFDGPGWLLDALAYLDAARAAGVPVALERSRSGEGGHVWTFFADPVPASAARRIGVFLVREAMSERAEMDLVSYDRLFPSQDFLPRQGFGNLIALPLQGECRKRGTTLFLDPQSLEPHADQWEFLSSLDRLSGQAACSMAESFGELRTGPAGATYRAPRPSTDAPPPPKEVKARRSSMLVIDRIGLPPAVLAALKHAASLPNPEFYEKERNRFWTGNTPRLIRCYDESLDELLVPRGVQVRASEILREAGSQLVVHDSFAPTETIDFELNAWLRPDQQDAVESLVKHDLGVLVAPPGAGKTVIACGVIARRRVPTLVVVDREPLIDQWRDRLIEHLGLERKQIGKLANRAKSSGLVDLAMAQSLARRDDLADVTARYGMVVVDECHHVPAVTFQRAVRQIPVQHWLGLTATPYRRDGLESMMVMHCGPIRHRLSAHPDAQVLHREIVIHETMHQAVPGNSIQELFKSLVSDADRTSRICDDISAASAEGRNSLVLTRWTEHLQALVVDLTGRGLHPLVLRGGLGKKARREIVDRLSDPELRGAILVATSSFLGEGFDCPTLDTVFLAFPIKFKGSVVQYVGRILRPTEAKTTVVVHDYIDISVPVLARMYTERARGYATLGFAAPRIDFGHR